MTAALLCWRLLMATAAALTFTNGVLLLWPSVFDASPWMAGVYFGLAAGFAVAGVFADRVL